MLELRQSATDKAIPFLMVSSSDHIARPTAGSMSGRGFLRGHSVLARFESEPISIPPHLMCSKR